MGAKKILSVAILLALVALAIFYLQRNIEDFKQLTITNPHFLIAIVLIFLITYIFISIVTTTLLRPLGVNIGKREAFALSIVTGFYNLITPFRGGMAARAVYLKKRYNFAYVGFSSGLLTYLLAFFLVASVLGIISTLV